MNTSTGVATAPSGIPIAAPRGLTISALICTAGRGASLLPAVRSILHPGSSCLELLVIDQSDDEGTERALQPMRNDPRLHYIRPCGKGKGYALNLGLTLARADIVAITDDDCQVAPDWIESHRQTMTENPHVAVTYGNVLPTEYDPNEGFIPDYLIADDRLCHNVWQKLSARGIGANMAVRSQVIKDLGGFDPYLGPGGRFFACVDGDITVRALLAGYQVYESSRSRVWHSGFRDWEQGRETTRRAWIGIGAAYAKPLKCGRWDALPLPLYEFVRYALLPFLWSVVRLRPQGWLRITSFVRGFRAGWRTPVDRAHLLYCAEASGAEYG